jgi:hypothetical protein
MAPKISARRKLLRKAARAAKKRLQQARRKRARAFQTLQAWDEIVGVASDTFVAANTTLHNEFAEMISDSDNDTDE